MDDLNKIKLFLTDRGQTFLEYAIVLGLITIIIFAMQPLIQRSINSMIKLVADQVGNQELAEQSFDGSGHLVESYTITRARPDSLRIDFLGNTNTHYGDVTHSFTNTLLDLGFTEVQAP